MPEPFAFTLPVTLDEVDVAEDEHIDLERLRQMAPQLAEWSDAQLAGAWADFSRDLRGISWSDTSSVDCREFLAFLMVKKLFPHVDAWAVGYEAFQQFGRDEPWVSWPEVMWPAWVRAGSAGRSGLAILTKLIERNPT